jgi:hypothetical protein
MSHFMIGPTELRVLLAIGTLVLLVHPMADVFGRQYRLFDVGGVVARAAWCSRWWSPRPPTHARSTRPNPPRRQANR